MNCHNLMQEYANNAPASMRGRVNISLLDTLPYLSLDVPKGTNFVQDFRNHIVQQTLLAYLSSAAQRGFMAAYWWRGPPLVSFSSVTARFPAA